MTHEESNIAISILSSLIVAGVFIVATTSRYAAGYFDGPDVLTLWAQSVLWFILVSIAVSIAVHIAYTIIRAAATSGAKPDMLVDERDKTIRASGVFVAMICLGAGCMAAVVVLALGLSGFAAFNVLLGFGALADLSGSVVKLVLYRRGY